MAQFERLSWDGRKLGKFSAVQLGNALLNLRNPAGDSQTTHTYSILLDTLRIARLETMRQMCIPGDEPNRFIRASWSFI